MKKVTITVSFEVDTRPENGYKFIDGEYLGVVSGIVRNIRHDISKTRFELVDRDGSYSSASPTNVVVVAKKS